MKVSNKCVLHQASASVQHSSIRMYHYLSFHIRPRTRLIWPEISKAAMCMTKVWAHQ